MRWRAMLLGAFYGLLWGIFFLSALYFAASFVRGSELRPVDAKYQIGHIVFFDASVLSAFGKTSCATCHDPDPELGYGDGHKLAVGAQARPGTPRGLLGARNTPSLLDCMERQGHGSNADGRVAGPYEACLQAVADKRVLANNSISDVLTRINGRKWYQDLAEKAYGPAALNEAELRECLCVFLGTLRSGDTPADRLWRREQRGYLAVRRSPFRAPVMPVRSVELERASGLTPAAIRGWDTFKSWCIVCHDPARGWRDYQYHDLGIAARSKSTDGLRGAILQPPDPNNRQVATPSLRNVARTRPYMHDGSLATLRECIEFFAKGGQWSRAGEPEHGRFRDPLIADIDLTDDEAEDLLAFVETAFIGPNYPFREDPFKESKK